MKFRRPRNRRSNANVNLKNQNFESSGPTGKIRGTAQQVYEKYIALARDVGTGLNSDRILAEKYYQFADHYYRLLLSVREQEERHQAKMQEKNQQNQEQPKYGVAGAEEENQEDEVKKISVPSARKSSFKKSKPQGAEEAAIPIADVDFLSVEKEVEDEQREIEEKPTTVKKRKRTPRKKDVPESSGASKEESSVADIKVMSVE